MDTGDTISSVNPDLVITHDMSSYPSLRGMTRRPTASYWFSIYDNEHRIPEYYLKRDGKLGSINIDVFTNQGVMKANVSFPAIQQSTAQTTEEPVSQSRQRWDQKLANITVRMLSDVLQDGDLSRFLITILPENSQSVFIRHGLILCSFPNENHDGKIVSNCTGIPEPINRMRIRADLSFSSSHREPTSQDDTRFLPHYVNRSPMMSGPFLFLLSGEPTYRYGPRVTPALRDRIQSSRG